MLRQFNSFLRSDDGAVTVDWVILTGAIVLLVIAVFPQIYNNTSTAALSIATMVTSQ